MKPQSDEIARLKALRDLAILDTAAEEAYDELTRSAALICQVPIALISLVDEHRQWFKSRVGLDASETPRELAFCDHAIREPGQVMEVGDAAADPRFANNPLVTGAPGIRFYAGAPLVDAAGFALGSLCVIDHQPRRLEPWQREVLTNLGRQVVRLFSTRVALAHAHLGTSRRQAMESASGVPRVVPTGVVQVSTTGAIQLNQVAHAIVGWSSTQVADLATWFACLHGPQAARARALYEQDRAAGFPHAQVMWFTRGDGQRRQGEFQGVRTAQGEVWLLRDVTETSGAEERFRVLFDHSSDAHLLFDEQGIIDCNRAAIDLLRCTDKQQVLGLHPARLSPAFQPDGRRSEEKRIEMDRLARERGSHRFEWLHCRLDGSEFRTEVTLTPVQISGQPVLLMVWHDLTERLLIEEKLRLDEERFRAISDVSPMGIYVTDVRGRAIYLNERWSELAGMATSAAQSEGWAKCLHPDDRQRIHEAWTVAVMGGRRFSGQYRYLHANGRVVWVQGDAVPMRLGGQVNGYVGVVSDITEQHQLEVRLRDSIKRFDLVVAGAGMGVWETSFDPARWREQFGPDLPCYWSPRLAEIMGYAPEEFPARLQPWLEAMHPDDLPRVRAAIEAYLADAVPYRVEYRLRQRSGEYHWYYATGEAQRDEQGRPLRFAGNISDITPRKRDEALLERARDEAQAAARAKSDFLATMSHELRTPMNGVIGMTTLLLDTPLNQQQKEFAETARTCGDQLLALISDILDFSKIEAGSLTLEHIPYSPRRLSEEAVALLADQAEKKGLQIVCLIGAEVPARLLGDPTRLRQVVLNLLSNALKFTDQGEVVLSITTLGSPPGCIELAVRDTGVGIAPEAREWLFKPFSQADSSTTRKYGGTGLGLVICQRLIHLMGGSIRFDSELGRGSTFTCRIPLSVAPDTTRELLHDGLVGRHVLVVGPSPAARRALREQFVGWGMTCAEVGEAIEVASMAAVKRPALVIIDHDLPGGGLALGRQLARDVAMVGVPIVLLVGGAHRGMATTAKEAGIVGFLTKPVRQAQLFECLLVVLEQASRVGDRAPAPQALLVTRHSLEEEREHRRVLVVEDNPVNRQVAVMMLNKLGCRCDIATNGQEAVEAVARQDYQVVFMDCQMPVMDGFAATGEIRRREAGERHVRIVALTANAMHGDRERCLAAGMDDYLAKPLQSSDLESALARTDQQRAAGTGSSAPAPASLEPLVDAAVLLALIAATDVETLKAVVVMIHTDAITALGELRAAVRVGDVVSLGRTAHRLKGSSATLGMRRVLECCQTLEQAARARQIEHVGSVVEALDRALAESLPALAKHPLVTG